MQKIFLSYILSYESFMQKRTVFLENQLVKQAHRQYLKNSDSKSIVHMIKHASLQLHWVHPDGVF